MIRWKYYGKQIRYKYMPQPVGRPSVVTESSLQKLESALRLGSCVDYACAVAGMASSTFYDHLSKDQEFSDNVKKWRGDTTALALEKERELINEKNVSVITNHLNKKHPDYKEKILSESKIDHSGNIKLENLTKMSTEQLLKLANGQEIDQTSPSDKDSTEEV